MKTLFVDHRDSFSANLASGLTAAGFDVHVVQAENLPCESAAIAELSSQFSVLVLSPGPGHPREYLASMKLYQNGFAHKPVMGVCLGLQLVLESEGFAIERICKNPIHGRQSALECFDESDVMGVAGLWVFYNSLGCLAPEAELLEKGWRVLARENGSVAAALHCDKPHFLVQFHPESFASPLGRILFEKFFKFCQKV